MSAAVPMVPAAVVKEELRVVDADCAPAIAAVSAAAVFNAPT